MRGTGAVAKAINRAWCQTFGHEPVTIFDKAHHDGRGRFVVDQMHTYCVRCKVPL